jgi:hypothetical protein
VDADPEAESHLGINPSVQFSKRFLDLDGTLDRINSRGKFRQDTITCRVGDPTTMPGDEPVQNLSMCHEGTESARLVLAHQPRVSGYISGKDCGQLTLKSLFSPYHSPKHLNCTLSERIIYRARVQEPAA